MTTPINISTQLIKVETSILKQNDDQKFALYITPTQEFSHQSIKHDIINVFIALDISGSMNCDVANIDDKPSNDSRYIFCVKSLRPLLQLFRKLVSVGKQIYLWLYAFNNDTQPIVENYIINDNDMCIDNIIAKCESIYPRFGTNISSVIRRIEREKGYLRIADNIRTISILLSDGFTNSGMTSLQIINTYPMFFDATIGIGEDIDYDAKLLKALSKENIVRGCMTTDDIYDQLIDAIFNDLEIYVDTMIINIPNDIQFIDSNMKYELDTRNKIYFYNLRYSQPLMLMFNGCPHSLDIELNGVKVPSSGINDLEDTITLENINEQQLINDFMDISFARIDQNVYDLDISLTDTGAEYYDINNVINIGYYSIISNYVHILKEFNSFDMDNSDAILNIKNKIDDTLNYIQNINIEATNSMKIILSQFKKRIDILHQNTLNQSLEDDIPDIIPHYTNNCQVNDNKRIRLTSNNNSPLSPSQSVASVRIMRNQAGNYASLARGLSEVYSQTPSY
jgi:hypothetical protein